MIRSSSVPLVPLPLPEGLDEIFKSSCSSPNITSSGFQTPYTTLNSDSLVQLLENPQSRGYDKVVIIDARYPYEFEGGHIFDAINCYTDAQITDTFRKYSKHENICFVFHCEFSSHRGPNAAKKFRSLDRKENVYPALSFPNLFLLEGGYAKFYSEYPRKCEGKYIQMREQQYIDDGSLSKCHSLCHPKQRRIQRCFSEEPFCKPLLMDGQTFGKFFHPSKTGW
jgi:M-phase inducer tyrosine phosphatase